MLTEITGPLLGGLGIFFVGASMVGTNMKKMTSRKLRLLFARFTSRDWQSALLGLVSGLVTQSTSVSAFIVAGLAGSGMMTVRNALPLIFWANAGCAVLVIIAVLDIKYLVFLLLFVSGVSVAFEVPHKFRFLARALFGIGLLFFGLRLIQQGAAPMAEMSWVSDLLTASHGSALLTFFLGTVLTVVTQTFIGVVLIGITMTKAGVFSVDQTIMLVYGAELGSSLVTWLLSSGTRGTSKQLIMSQAVFNILAVSTMVLLFYLEHLFHIPLIKALVLAMSADLEMGLAYLVVLYNWAIPVLASFLYTPIQRGLERIWPPTQEETLAKIKFIKDLALDSPDTALMLVEQELMRLVNRLPVYMQGISSPGGTRDGSCDIAAYHTAFENLGREIGYTLADISELELDEDTSGRLLRLLNVQDLLGALERNLVAFCQAAGASSLGPSVARFLEVIAQSQEFLLMQAVDAFAGNDLEDVSILRTMTSDSGEMVESVRKQYLEAEEGLGFREKAGLYRVSGLFERSAWLLNRLSVIVEESMEPAA